MAKQTPPQATKQGPIAKVRGFVQEVKTEMVEEEKMNKLDPSQPHLKVKMKV